MSSIKSSFLLALLLIVGIGAIYLISEENSPKSTVSKVVKNKDTELELLFTKSSSYKPIYNRVSAEASSKVEGKALITYLEAVRLGDTKRLAAFSKEQSIPEYKRLVSFYQALDYETLKVGKVLPEIKPSTTEIQLIFSINGNEVAKNLQLYLDTENNVRITETNDLELVKKDSSLKDPVLEAILNQFGSWMDYQPTMGIVDFNKEGIENNFAFNYPLLLSLKTKKEIDELTLSRDYKSYFTIQFEGITLLISRTDNEVQAELNHSKRYLLTGGEKEMKALQGYAAEFNKDL